MKLENITIRSVPANGVYEFLKTIEQLPDNVISGSYFCIYAYKAGDETHLAFSFDEEKNRETAQFNIPSESKNEQKGRYWRTFDYKDIRYDIHLDIEPDGL